MTFKCQFCGKSYQKEKTLTVHLCEQKRRWLNKDDKHVVLALLAYQRFYQISMGAKTPMDYKSFSNSQYYSAFVKFGKHIVDIDAVDPEKFIDFVIRSSVSVDRWCVDSVYEAYLSELNRKETAERALERGIMLMQEWASNTGNQFYEFFRKNTKSRIIHCIRSGRISPWILFNCVSGVTTLEGFDDAELKLVNNVLEPEFWTRKFQVRANDVAFVKNVLKEAGL